MIHSILSIHLQKSHKQKVELTLTIPTLMPLSPHNDNVYIHKTKCNQQGKLTGTTNKNRYRNISRIPSENLFIWNKHPKKMVSVELKDFLDNEEQLLSRNKEREKSERWCCLKTGDWDCFVFFCSSKKALISAKSNTRELTLKNTGTRPNETASKAAVWDQIHCQTIDSRVEKGREKGSRKQN